MPKLLSHRVRWSWDSVLKGRQGLGGGRGAEGEECRLRGKLGMLSGHLSQRNPLNADKQYSALSEHFPRERCYYEETEVREIE